MIRKIVLENFMAHGRTELALGAGLTALTGPNNSGKSAVVEALRCVATNPVPKYFIRHGASEARVEVWLEDGTCVAWVRKKASAIYEILRPGATEPEVYAKFGRKIPDDVADLLRLDPVELDSDPGSPVDVHIGNQRTPIFIMGDNSPARRMADFFASSTESAHLLSMQKLLEKRVKDEKRAAAAQRARMSAIEDELDVMAPLPDLALRLERVRENEAAMDAVRRLIPALEGMLAAKARLEARRGEGELRLSRLAALDVVTPPRLWPVTALAVWLERRAALGAANDAQTRRAGTLAPLVAPPSLHPASELARMAETLRRLAAARRTERARLEPLSGLREAPPLFECAVLSRRIGALAERRTARTRSAKSVQALAELRTAPELAALAPLRAMGDDLAGLRARRANIRSELHDLDEAMTRLHARIEERLRSIGDCPLCGAELETARFLRKEGGR